MTSLSIIIPVYNEQELIPELCRRVAESAEKTGTDYEVIFINDGSTDSTLELLLETRKQNTRLKVLNLSRNFGHQAAFTAGLNYAKGEYTVMMDGDLQDPPELIPDLLNKLHTSGSDIVYGKRTGRKAPLSIRILTWLFHKIFDRLNKNTQGDTGNFCLLNRKALDAFLMLNEKNRYLPGLRFFIGFKQEYVAYHRPERSAGKAKMSFWKLMKLAFDAIFSFSKIPIRIALIIGIIGILISAVGIGIVIYKKLTGDAITGWTSTMLSIYFLGSVQLFFLGILGEYVFRIYKETQNRPVYVVKEYFA
ncbi:TPA: glycosyltransferase [bacterium]|nr:glycosyltransferase [bacterium]